MRISRSSMAGDRLFNAIIIAMLGVTVLVTLYPMYYVLIASVSHPLFISTGQVLLIPKGLNTHAYSALLEDARIWLGYRNSLFYTTVGTSLNLLVTLPCAYALSRPKLPGRKAFFFFFIFTMYFSGGVTPTYLLVSRLNLINTVWIMIIPGSVGVFNLLIARNFFQENIPEELYDSARIDGASVTRFFIGFVLPLSKAIIAVLALFFALSRWNDYFNALIYLQDDNLQTLQVIIRSITAKLDTSMVESIDPGKVSAIIQKKQLLKYAVVVVSIAPMLLLYPVIQRYFVTGIMLGAVKG